MNARGGGATHRRAAPILFGAEVSKNVKLLEMVARAKADGKRQVLRFMDDMKKAGLDVRYYRGHFSWAGPCVHVDSVDIALQATKVKCQWAQLGLGYVVYPVERLHDWS